LFSCLCRHSAQQNRSAYEDDEAEFECKAKTTTAEGEIEDKIKFTVKAKKEKSLKIKIEYETEIETEDMESETETQYTVVFDRLLEYRKADTSFAVSRSNNPDLDTQPDRTHQEFTWGEDEVVAEWFMEEWSDFSPLETDGKMMKFSASTLGDLVTFTFTIHESGDGTDITANSMKIDFMLEGYPWAASGDTYVALICHIETRFEVDIESDDDDEDQSMDVLISFDDAVETVGFTPFGQYTWADYAEVRTLADDNTADIGDGNNTRYLSESATIPVVATTSPRASSEADPSITFNEIAFSFIGAGRGASQIYWDPEAGIGYADEGGTTATGASSAQERTTMGSLVFVAGVSTFMSFMSV
jgi:hypothetical protein